MKYNIWDMVLYWDKTLLYGYFPMEVEIMSKRKLWLFWHYHYTRILEKYSDTIPEWRTKRIYERNIERFIKSKKWKWVL